MFYNNFQKLCKEKRISASRALAEMGMSAGILTWWKKGAIPKTDTARKIADYFGVSVDELLAGAEPPPSKLTTEKGVRIAVVSTVGAGIPMEAINTFDSDDPDSWEEISQLEARRGIHFGLRIRGDSMEPEIRHGDIVIVRRSDEFQDGEIVVALVNGDEGVCKILKYRDNGIELRSFNPEYPPMVFTKDQIKDLPVRLLGVCTEVRHRLER